jgi:hypothetical protein
VIKIGRRVQRFGTRIALFEEMARRKGKLKLYFGLIVLFVPAAAFPFFKPVLDVYWWAYYPVLAFYIYYVSHLNFSDWRKAKLLQSRLKESDCFVCYECGGNLRRQDVHYAWLFFDEPTPMCRTCKVMVYKRE